MRRFVLFLWCVALLHAASSSSIQTSTTDLYLSSVISDKASILLITADGTVSSLDSVTGKENWSLHTGKPLVSSSVVSVEDSQVWIPSLDGSGEIYYLSESGVMQKLPVTVHDIVASSPLFHQSDSGSDTLFIGSKSTSIFAVDPTTGRLLKIMSNQPNNGFGNNDGVSTYDDCPAGLPESTLLIGRADYYIRAMDPISGLERWNVSIGEYIPYLTSREKIGSSTDLPQLISQGNWVHAVNLGSDKPEWSAAIRAPPVTAFTLSGANSHLQKMGFAHAVPSTASLPPSSSSALVPQSHVYVATIDDQPFATTNPTVVYHDPYLLPAPPSSTPDPDPAAGTGLIKPPTNPPVPGGLYPVVEYGRWKENDTILVSDDADDLPPFLHPYYSFLPPYLRALLVQPQFLFPLLGLACVVVLGGIVVLVRMQKKSKHKLRVRSNSNNKKSTPASTVTEPLKPPTPHKPNEKKKEISQERKNIVPEITDNNPNPISENNNNENDKEVDKADIDAAGNDGDTKIPPTKNTPNKRKPPKRKPKVSAQLSFFSNTRGKNKNKNGEGEGAIEGEEEEGEPSGEKGEGDDARKESGTKSVRIVTENGITKIGKLEITPTILGYGSGGTIVFEGFLHGRRVAVKRMLAQFMDLAQQEINLLIHSDEHPNVVRYHAKEEDEEFVYLALSYCPHTLHHVIEHNVNAVVNFEFRKRKAEPYPELDDNIMRILRELVTGVAHLHTLNIVHRDIKPQNTLLDPYTRVKISDMGLAKKLEIDQSSFSGADTGSFGWKAPEVLTGGEGRLTKAVDIFSLGCMIFYILTKTHPFGDRYEREGRILTGRSDLREVEGWPESHHLIKAMIQTNPEDRPSAQEILHHPFFWSTQQKMHFLIAASDYVEFEKPTAPVVIALDLRIGDVIRPPNPMRAAAAAAAASGALPPDPTRMTDWLPALDPHLVANLVRYRAYKSTSLRDLLRVIRNKYNHFRDLPPELQQVLGSVPEGFYGYFRERFPRLLLCCFEVVKEFFGDEDVFRPYFYHRPLKTTTNA